MRHGSGGIVRDSGLRGWPARIGRDNAAPWRSAPHTGRGAGARITVLGSRGALWLLLLSLLVMPAPAAAGSAAATARGGGASPLVTGAGGDALIPAWNIQSSARAGLDGGAISSSGYSANGWYAAPARSTVLGALVDDGRYPFDPFYSDNLNRISGEEFTVPWWFRADISLGSTSGVHTFLRLNGVIPRADVWVNGIQVASHDSLAGAFNVQELDITNQVRAGMNAVAVLVYPANPLRDLIMGWIDWNQWPPDNNMGLWRGVDVLQAGPVTLRGPRADTTVELPGLDSADLTVRADLTNLSGGPVTATVSGSINPEGGSGAIELSQTVSLAAGATTTVTFSPGMYPQLHLDHPRIWWPSQLGGQPLYDLTLVATVHDGLSDRVTATFGIRDVRSELTPQGKHRLFLVNGRPLLIRGGGWAPDLFLRYDPSQIEQSMLYARDLGLNTIRLEGKLENDIFYDLADRYGILILPGWECCDKWEAWAHTGGKPWTPQDYDTAGESMASEAQLLRNHASVIAFLIGSDNSPPDAIAKIYADALHTNDWPDPIVSSAAGGGNGITGPSGMKMAGPYDWEPPNYWYTDRLGGAFGFSTEISAGNMIPTLDSLQRFMSPTELRHLWQEPNTPQFHASPTRGHSPFATLAYFDRAMTRRLGKPGSLSDYVEKAQLMNYETNRAQFEAYQRNVTGSNPATGVVYWMFNNAWPSLHWHLFDSYFEPGGAYFGAKKAGEPLHVQWSYDDRSVVVVNQTASARVGLSVEVRLYDLSGRVIYARSAGGIAVPSLGVTRVFTVPKPTGISGVHFVELVLRDSSNATVSRNVYWLASTPDTLDFARSTWWYTPQAQWGDFSGLATLPQVVPSIEASSTRAGDSVTTSITVSQPASAGNVAFFMGVKIRQGFAGSEVLPITWNDNFITLWPGESLALRATYPLAGLHGAVPEVDLAGWNVPDQQVSAPLR
ncbi:MAG TPA: glycoside hydrolase family 2 [Chloroflexota bacterium]|nr:glycoside hydrolase family 2 [Chloroflexota bacterium]